MNIKKLVGMSRDKNPSTWLAKLSIYWAKQNKMGNPVKNAVSLWHWRWFMAIDLSVFAVWLIITIIWNPQTSAIAGGPSLWAWIVMVLVGGPLFVVSMSSIERFSFADYRDAKDFIKAITLVEVILGRPIDTWNEGDALEESVEVYLAHWATAVKAAETAEKSERERVPWMKLSDDHTANPQRRVFEKEFALLTPLLPIPKDRGIYYGDKSSDNTEVPATS